MRNEIIGNVAAAVIAGSILATAWLLFTY